jgi:hypothetical protein
VSEIADKIRTWGESDCLITCYRSELPIQSAYCECELCGRSIAAVDESRMKARQPGWHLICRECVNEVRRLHEVKFGGRFRTDEEARKVLPAQEESKK